MSVAFRRDSDEEHHEPRFELPIPPGPNPVTARGQRLIEQTMDALQRAALDESDEQRAERERDLRYWRARLATARLAPIAVGDEIAFGTRVRLRRKGGDRVVDIVGHDEADPAAGSISFAAPLARALMGAVVGDVIETAQGEVEILTVAPIPG